MIVATVLSVLFVACATKWYGACMPGVRAVRMEVILLTYRSGGKSISNVLLAVDIFVNTANGISDKCSCVSCFSVETNTKLV